MQQRKKAGWLVSQIGAGDHYLLPRMLLNEGLLGSFVTDFWSPQILRSLAPHLPTRYASAGMRYHSALHKADIFDLGLAYLAKKIATRAMNTARGWQSIESDNQFFARRASVILQRICGRQEISGVIANSYSALETFEAATKLGLPKVMAQIDGGVHAESIYEEEYKRLGLQARRPSEAYRTRWLAECALADLIVVNSNWAKACLTSAGVSETKLRIVPLAYEFPRACNAGAAASSSHGSMQRFPPKFSRECPLQVVY